jgi:hypothetical protein
MYVIATVSCPNFHFSVSPHVTFLNLLFEQKANSNEYLLANFGFDTAENEPCQVCPIEQCKLAGGDELSTRGLHFLGLSFVRKIFCMILHDLVKLGESCPTSLLLDEIDVDTAENNPEKEANA